MPKMSAASANKRGGGANNISGVMALAKKNRKKEKQAPVLTGHDERAERREGRDGSWERESDAPDGVTGNWS